MRGQLSLEYAFAVLAWIVICLLISQFINSYLSLFTYQQSMASYSSTAGFVSELAASDIDGFRYAYTYLDFDKNLTFNNTIASIRLSSGEIIARSPTNYTYADSFKQGDDILIKNQDGRILMVKVA